ncbi:histone-fold-containing protein [Dendrothele bispora CBS 962.96]|uniref:Histone-fold-containing protein n=1 Tax=Dendrothele bispora (strain CBS 962.96) TaxID=1314807 RepID=A0A4S8MM11_DENBC|nr:histone-fold-containing protein [Dendrothele bispora CBS 962.96]
MKNKNKQTKFPVARIKKIMQKDEDVGKVAQATPIVISKALELFLATLVEGAGKVTADRGSKKVEAYHLKYAVETTEMFDFLKEIVESVPDPSAGGTIQLASANAEKKKKPKGKKAANDGDGAAPKRRRKKKTEENGNGAAEEPRDEDAEMGEGGKSEQEERMKEDEDDYDGKWEQQRRPTDDEEDDDDDR